MIEPNILAFQQIELLQAIAAPPEGGWGKAALAAKLGRDHSNLNKTIKLLTAEKIVAADGLTLTDAGQAQLAAFNRARHGGERRKAQGRWRADALQRNPVNRAPDPVHVGDIAGTIKEVGDVLVPIVLSPPDAHGVRTIWAGEHRWEAVKLLIEWGECPDVLADDGILFTERAADPGEAAVIALIENSTRRDLNPWQDAQQLRTAADGLNLSAAELARRIGRAQEGSRGGVRDVQVKLKVAREATLAAVRAYEADPGAPGAWEILRDSVSEKRPEAEIVTTKAQRLALAELFARADQVVGAEVRILPAGHTAEGARLAQYGLAVLIRDAKGDRARVTQAGADYLKAEDLSYPWQLVAYAREKLGFPAGWGTSVARTEWLNVLPTSTAAPVPPAADVEALKGIEPVAPNDPLIVNGVRHPNATRAAEARRLAAGGGPVNSGGRRTEQQSAREETSPRPVAHPIITAGDQTHPTNAALKLLAEERFRQVSTEGYGPDHDDEQNGDGELAQAAAAYAAASSGDPDAALFWPGGWNPYAFKPTGEVRDLIKAGALIVAEIERRLRAGETA